MKAVLSCLLATVAGVSLLEACRFWRTKELDMGYFEHFLDLVDAMPDTKRKRHIAGGIMLSASLLFGGLALTVVTIKD